MGVREFKPLLHTHLQNGSHSKALKEVRGIKASLVVQWLRLCIATGGNIGLIPVWEVLHASRYNQKNKLKNTLKKNLNI